MKWEDYYEKINDWAVSTAVSKISSLEDMGTADEIVDALNIIAFEDEKGATRLLNRAIQCGVKFSGDNLAEISSICSEDSFKKALEQSADALTAQDLEDLYGCVDDELIVEIAKKYSIKAPADIEEDYTEELCTDTSAPISWSKFYDGFYEWSSAYAIARSKAINDFGSGEEVVEVATELFSTDIPEASNFIRRAIEAGVLFHEDELMEISALCDEDTTREAVLNAGIIISDDALEELYGIVNDEVIIEVAKKQGLKVPEDLQEDVEDEDDTTFMYDVRSAIEAADYALQCLHSAETAVNTSSSASVLDMFTTGFLTSLMKHSSLEDAEYEIRIAGQALDSLNMELDAIKRSKSVHLQSSRLTSVIDLWFDSGFMDCITHLQIDKVRRKIRGAIRQVEAIKRELHSIVR